MEHLLVLPGPCYWHPLALASASSIHCLAGRAGLSTSSTYSTATGLNIAAWVRCCCCAAAAAAAFESLGVQESKGESEG